MLNKVYGNGFYSIFTNALFFNILQGFSDPKKLCTDGLHAVRLVTY